MTQSKSLGGLVNLGLTCYANAVLQCMRHCPKLTWLFENGRYDTLLQGNSPKTQMTKSFAEIVQLLENCRRGQSVRPADFLTKFRTAIRGSGFEHLAQAAPHDSYEFYLCLIDLLHESLAQEVEMSIKRPSLTDHDKRCVQALEVWRNEFEKKYSPFVDLAYGLFYFVVECGGCKGKTYRWEPFTNLKGVVDPTKTQTLDEMLKAELVPEQISGYDCEKCSPVRQTATRSVYIWKLPRYPVVVLKRFTPDGRKIDTPVSMASASVSFKNIFTPDSPEFENLTDYTLLSIVDHHGGAQGGHYTAQCKSEGVWYVYDDESTHTIPSGAPMLGSSTYMLWFGSVMP